MNEIEAQLDAATPATDGQYVVVARRYRPQDFGELVGQQQVSTALANAINTNRVGHAYLFTGARGVGKTSTARILAKCLNCAEGPTPTPCGQCDSCLSIAAGEDVDVLEIDGASNRRIDEIREIRSNVNIRPSRSRNKIYIIDEVHMLTKEAFNALLKTLEEPPEHVKFIFCTTDPEKLPITVISRCQRFDFVGIQTDSIVGRLKHIVQTEKVNVEDAALALIARRAGGSMRDSQSLLEQLLSFGGESITIADVHALFGTANNGRVWQIVRAMIASDAASALKEFDAAVGEGADAGQVVEQLTGCFRDLMARLVGCNDEMLLTTGGEELAELEKSVAALSLPNTLAALQIFDASLSRMRQSTQARMVAETAIVRVCCLEQLDDMATIVGQLRAGGLGEVKVSPPTQNKPAQKKTAEIRPEPARAVSPPENRPAPTQQRVDPPHGDLPSSPPVPKSAPASSTTTSNGKETATVARVETTPLNEGNLPRIWKEVLGNLEGLTEMHAARCPAPTISAPNRLAIRFPATYTSSMAFFERPQQRQALEQALQKVVGQTVRVEFAVETTKGQPVRPAAPKLSQVQLKQQVTSHPLVQFVAEMLDGTVVAVEPPKANRGTDL